MKLGFVSAILDTYSFEEVIDFASSHGFECVEMACWPGGKAERRYAGVSHINVDDMSEENISYIKDYCAKKNVEISSLAFYPNTMDEDLEKRNANIEHLKKVLCAMLAAVMVTMSLTSVSYTHLSPFLSEKEISLILSLIFRFLISKISSPSVSYVLSTHSNFF